MKSINKSDKPLRSSGLNLTTVWVQGPHLGDYMEKYLRLNQIVLDLSEVECIEWKQIDDEEQYSEKTLYSIRLHLKSGKMFTRQVYDTQFEEIKEQLKEILEGE